MKSLFSKNAPFTKGLIDGVPIALGYLSVSFGFGILAVRSGLTTLISVLISAVNLTSAGQAAISKKASFFSSYRFINLRYGLMSLSLSQKLDSTFNTPRRLLVAYGITDEIFAVASAQKGLLTARYMYGLISVSTLGWCTGTLLGASAGQLLPASLTNAMGIVLYAMFIAIVIPPARKSRGVLVVAATAAVCSMAFKYLLPQITGGFAIIFSAVIAAVLGALVFPVADETEVAEP